MDRTEALPALRPWLVAFESDPVFAPDGTICARHRLRTRAPRLETGAESEDRKIRRRASRDPAGETKAR